jgi:hypothetical protein
MFSSRLGSKLTSVSFHQKVFQSSRPYPSDDLLRIIVAQDDLPSFQSLWNAGIPNRFQLKVNLKREENGCDRSLMAAADTPDWLIALPSTTRIFQFVNEQMMRK